MIQTLSAAVKRLHIGQILFRLVIVLVLLLAGYVLRGFAPKDWAQPFQIDSMTLPNGVVQGPISVASQTNRANVETGINGIGGSNTVIGVSTTPTPTYSIATNLGIVTVITLTPARNVLATDLVPTGTLPEISGQWQTSLPPARVTQTSSTSPYLDAVEPTKTLTVTSAVLSFSPELPPAITRIRTDMIDLVGMVKVTGVMLQTFNQGQPTDEELAALQAQLTVVAQRIEKLGEKLETAQAGLEIFGSDARISPGQVRDILDLLLQSVRIEQSMLSGPAEDSTTLVQAQTMFEKLQQVLEQVQSLIAPNQDANSFVNAPVTLTMTPRPPTPMLAPTATPTPVTMLNDQMSQLQTMLRQMEEMLRNMQSMLELIQNQPGSGTVVDP